MSTPDVPEPLISSPEVKKLPCASGQFFGRPNWGRIFKQRFGPKGFAEFCCKVIWSDDVEVRICEYGEDSDDVN